MSTCLPLSELSTAFNGFPLHTQFAQYLYCSEEDEEDHEMGLRALGRASKWTLSKHFFVKLKQYSSKIKSKRSHLRLFFHTEFKKDFKSSTHNSPLRFF